MKRAMDRLIAKRKAATTEQLRRELAQRRMPRLPSPTDAGYAGERGKATA